MLRATTSKHSVTLDVNHEETFSEILITYAQNGKIILEKHKSDLTFETCDCFGWKPVYTAFVKLTQEETKLFAANPKGIVNIQVRALTEDGDAIASDIEQISVQNVLNDEVL